MKKVYSLLILLAMVVLGSCTSGKKALEKGDYYQSCIQAIERLRKNPDHKKSREVLLRSYPLAIQYYNDKINNLRQTNNRFKNNEIVENYKSLNRLYEEIQRSPGALEVVPNAHKYYDEVMTYSKLAAEERYKAGMEELGTGNRENAREAYFHFLKANEYYPNYKDVRDKIEEAREMATLKVLVDQIPVPTLQYQLSVDFFQDRVEEFLTNYNDNEFIRFFPISDRRIKDPDQIMVIQFDDFIVGNVNNYQSTKEYKNDSVVVGTVKIGDGTEKEVIGSVKANYTEYRREVISKGLVSMRILNPDNNQVLLHEKFPGEFVWGSYWASFNGDERALTREQIERSKRRPQSPPPPQELFIEFCKPIYDQLTGKVRSFYRNY